MRRRRGGASAGRGGREGRSGATGLGAGGPAKAPARPARTPRLRVRPGERTHNGEPYVVPTQCAADRCAGLGHAHAPRTRERFGGPSGNPNPLGTHYRGVLISKQTISAKSEMVLTRYSTKSGDFGR